MSSSTRSRSNLHVKFADNIHLDDDQWRLDQHQGDVDNMNELPVARFQPEHERHIKDNNPTDSGIERKRRGRPVKRDQLNNIDTDWHVEEKNNYLDLSPADVTLRSQGNPSVYEFSENSKQKSVNSTETNLARRSAKTPIKVRRDEKHPCSYCNYCTNKKYLLQRHLKSHSTERPHKCNYCSNTFKTTAQLQNHVNTHLGIKPFQCKFCEYKFTTSGELIRHVRYKHTFEKPHKCEVCGYATVELSKLRRHIRTHTGEKPYACPHCSYCSPDTFKLKRHLRVHTGERPYQCTICKFRFTQSNSLKAHMLTHQPNVQKFHCTYCSAVLTRKADLKQHMIKKHANDDNFLTCLQCDQEFAHPRELNEHKKLHHANSRMNTPRVQLSSPLKTSETPSQNVLDEHVDSQQHDNRAYQCYECGLMYVTHKDLRQHVRKVHRHDIDAGRPAGGLSVRTKPYPFTSTMKEDKEIIDNEANPDEEISNRRRGQQMAIIQFRNQHNDSKQSSLIVRIDQDADDDLETADGFLSNKLTPNSRRFSQKEFSSCPNENMNEQGDDHMETNDQEYEIGDAFVELIDDNLSLVDEDETNLIFKSRSKTTTLKSN